MSCQPIVIKIKAVKKTFFDENWHKAENQVKTKKKPSQSEYSFLTFENLLLPLPGCQTLILVFRRDLG